ARGLAVCAGCPVHRGDPAAAQGRGRAVDPALGPLARAQGEGHRMKAPHITQVRSTSALLYLSGITVSFDGFKALNNLSLLAQPTKAENNRLEEILSIIRMGPQQHMPAARLSHGQKQWLEIGMLLAQDPKLLLVDEPVAGMTDVETETTAHVLRDINKTHSV